MKKIFDRIIFCHKPKNHFTYGGLTVADDRIKIALGSLTDDLIDYSFDMMDYNVNHLKKYYNLSKTIIHNYTKKDIEEIESKFSLKGRCLLFVSHSSYGTFVKYFKDRYPDVEIAVFFHNIEIQMAYNRFVRRHMPGGFFELFRDFRSERMVAKYADFIFLMNSRDENLFRKFYKNHPVVHFPMTIVDRYKSDVDVPNNSQLKLLFVGTYFWGNIPGLIQFVDKVMPYINAELYIVGKDMEKIEKHLMYKERIHLIGRVDDETLDSYYINSDVVIAPVLSGGGMKTKVAEAMMYGRPVIGTKEAYCGYNFPPEEIGFCSDNIGDYVSFINIFANDRPLLKQKSIRAREIYEKGYSLKKTIEILYDTFVK